jgi:hypothetical protein
MVLGGEVVCPATATDSGWFPVFSCPDPWRGHQIGHSSASTRSTHLLDCQYAYHSCVCWVLVVLRPCLLTICKSTSTQPSLKVAALYCYTSTSTHANQHELAVMWTPATHTSKQRTVDTAGTTAWQVRHGPQPVQHKRQSTSGQATHGQGRNR